MGLKLKFARIWGAATVLAALSLAPSVAQAHAGHDHHVRGVVTATDAAKTSTDAKIATVQAELRATKAWPAKSSKPSACQSGCCAGVPCMTCAGLLDTAELSATGPSSLSSRLELPQAPSRDSPDLEGIRKPPRFFV